MAKRTLVALSLYDSDIKDLDKLAKATGHTRSLIARAFYQAGKKDHENRINRARDGADTVSDLLRLLEHSKTSAQSSREC